MLCRQSKRLSISGSPLYKRLDFAGLPLYGRTKEIKILQDAYRQVTDPNSSGFSRVVIIHGSSGTGKSALVRRTFEKEEKAYFVSGKFDQLRTAEPYSALTSAFNDLCEFILASGERETVLKLISKAMGSEAKALMNVIPKLRGLIDGSDPHNISCNDNDCTVDVDADVKAALSHLTVVCRSFVESVCTAAHPVVLFIDDLQWADPSSMEIIRCITTDPKCKHFLFIGAYRDNEIDHHHPLSSILHEIENKKRIYSIPTGNLHVEDVNSLFASLTKIDKKATQPLADIVHRKTNGNIFFVLEFLEMLQEEDFLEFCVATLSWKWDIDLIQSRTSLSLNVVDLVADRVQRLDQDVQTILKIAACFGSRFDVNIMDAIIHGLPMEECRDINNRDDLVRLIGVGVAEGFVEELQTGSKYKFGHDRIQQAAYSLITEGKERDLLHLRIGMVLRKMMKCNGIQDDWMTFAAVDQLNRGSTYLHSDTERTDLARLNLQAGKKAAAVASYATAQKYLLSGIELLEKQDNMWRENYELCLGLHNAAADMAYCNGEPERCRRIFDAVLSNSKCQMDEIHVHVIHMDSLGAQYRLTEAINVGISALNLIGEQFPKQPALIHVIASLLKTKKMLRNYSDERILAIPAIEDKMASIAIKIMSTMVAYAWFEKKEKLYALLVLRIVQRSLQHGISAYSSHGFSLYGQILACQGDIRQAYRFGKLALDLIRLHNATVSEARVLGMMNHWLLHWQEPIHQNLDKVLHGYISGMKNQDISWACICANVYVMDYIACGLPLPPVDRDMRALSKHMVKYKQTLQMTVILPFWQYALNLMGRSKNALVLTVEAMDEDSYIREMKETNNAPSLIFCRLHLLCLAYLFGDMRTANKLSKKLHRTITQVKGGVLYPLFLFFAGLSSIELARRKKSIRALYHRTCAQKCIKILRKFAKQGAVNCVHQVMLLEAEYNGLDSYDDETKRLYDTVISTATRAGFLRDVAIANERAAMFHWNAGDPDMSSFYMSRAHERYCDWGAQAKADDLVNRYGSMFTPKDSVAFGSANLGVSRFFNSGSGQGNLESALEEIF